MAVLKWKKNHTPPPSIVRKLIQSYGFGKVTDYPTLGKIIRTLPASLDEEGAIWFHSSPVCIVFFSSFDSNFPYEIYSRISPRFKITSKVLNRWTRLGPSWEGIKALELELGQMNLKNDSISNKASKKLKKWIDPRSLIF